MKQKILVSGFGGQGVMMIGNILAEAAFESGLLVTVMPTYGAEQRGGTANTTVIISDTPIGSPAAPHPDLLIAMNQVSVMKFGPNIISGGRLLTNKGQVEKLPDRNDITCMEIDAEAIALEAGAVKTANVAILGAVVGSMNGVIPFEIAESVMIKKLAKKPEFAEMNKKAFQHGYDVGAGFAK